MSSSRAVRFVLRRLFSKWTTLASAALLLFVAPAAAHAAPSALDTGPFSSKTAKFLAGAGPILPDGFTDTVSWSGLEAPTAIRFAPDGRVFVAEQSGLVQVYDNLADPTPTTYVDLRRQVYQFADKGLLGLAIDPQFTTGRPYIYVLYTYDKDPNSPTFPRWNDDCPDPPGADGDGCVDQARLSRIDPDGTEHVLVTDWCGQYSTHTIGALNFDSTGALYASGGDGASYTFADYGQGGNPVNPCGDPPGGVGGAMTTPTAQGGALRAQSFRRSASSPVTLDGTIIRVNPDTGDAMPDNPNAGDANANRRRIIAYGFRNPFRFTIRPGTSEVWMGDVGWNNYEEINRVPDLGSVRNYGWPCYEGNGKMGAYDTLNLNLCESLYSAGTTTPPYFVYAHGETVAGDQDCQPGTSSTTGVSFYTGTQFPAEYRNALFTADFARGCLLVMQAGTNGLPDPSTTHVFEDFASGPVDVQMGPDGALYYVDLVGGEIHKISYPAGNNVPTASATASPDAGPTPLTVTFDGSASSDPDGGTLTYTWDLDGDGTFGDANTVTATHTYTTPGNYTAQLRVMDADGATDTLSIPITAGNAPVPTIDAPTAAFTWATGDTINFSGSAVDGHGNPIPASGLSWRLNIRHCSRITASSCHTHAGSLVAGVSSGTLIAPDHDYPSHLELVLTATDADGLHASKTVDLYPKTVDLTFASTPTGAQLSAGADTGTAPYTYTFIQNSTTNVTAETPQIISGVPYAFSSWSDGGAATHTITVPRTDTTLTANFARVTEATLAGEDVTGSNVSSAAPGHGEVYQTSGDIAGSATKLRLYVDGGSTATRLALALYADVENAPGPLIAQAETTAITPGAWNEVTLPSAITIVPGTNYWIGMLNPSTGTGTLKWRDRAGGAGGAERTSVDSPLLATFPNAWQTGGIYSDGPVSANAYGAPAGAPVDPVLAASPTSLAFNAVVGGANPAAQTVSVTNTGGGTLNFTATDDAAWLTETPSSGAAPQDVVASVNSAGLAAGTYTATITVTSSGTSGSPKTIPITLTVSAATPVLAASPSALTFNGTAGGANPAGQTLTISNAGGGSLSYTAADDAAWLSETPTSGTAPKDVSVSVDTTGLAAGTYTATITLTAAGASGSPKTIPVTLTVTPPATSSTLAGYETVGTSVSSAPPGAGESYKMTATATGVATKLRLYVEPGSGANALVLGLYADSSGNPGALLSSGRITTVTKGAWNEVSLAAGVSLTAGTPYWFGLLNPTGSGGTLSWRDHADGVGGGPEKTSSGRSLSDLPALWTSLGSWSDGPVSGYALSGAPPAPAVLSTSPASLAFSGTAGAANPAAKTISVTNTGGGTLSYTATDDAAWLAETPTSGSAPGTVSAAVDTTGLAAGTYTATITITSSGTSGSPKTIPVTLTVAPAPAVLATSPASLSFSGTAGAANPAAKTVSVTNTGGGTLSYTATDDAAWLTETPTSGSAPGTVSAAVDTTGLAAGTYTATITITSSGTSGSPKTIPVTLTIAAAPVLATSPATMTFSATIGDPSPTQALIISNTGGGTLTYTVATDQTWLTASPTSGTAPSSSIITANPTGLAAGTYNGNVTVTATGVSGSPKTIPVTFTVLAPPVLSVSPASLAFAGTAGAASPASKTVSVSNTGGGTLNYTATDNATWLTESPTSGSAPGTVTAAVDTTGLAAGTYSANITVTSSGTSGSPKTIPVTLTLAAPPVLATSPASLSFSGTVGAANPAAKTISVTNTGGGTLSYTATDDAAWLAETPTSGSAPDTVSATVDITSMAAGTYTATITVTSSGTSGSPKSIPVTLTIGTAPPVLTTSPASLSFSGTAGAANPAAKTISVTNTGGGALSYTATDDAAWLTETPTSGSAPDTVSAAVDTTGLAAGTYSANITVTSSGTSGSPKTIPVTLTIAPAPAVLATSPASLSFSGTVGGTNPAAKTVSVTNTGGGTLSYTATDDAAWLTETPTSGSAPDTVSATVDTTSMAAGTYTATITVTSSGTSGSPKTIPVTLTIAPAPVLATSPATMTFSATIGDPSPTQALIISNTGGGTLTYTVATDQTWLTASPTNGTAPSSSIITANPTGLAAGTYNGNVTVTATGVSGSPKTIPVTFTVAAAPAPALSVSPTTLAFAGTAGAASPAAKSVSVTNTGTGTLNYTATDDAAWLTESPTSGAAPGTVNATVDTTGLTAGTYTATITVTSNGASGSPKTIPVTLTLAAPPPVLTATPASLAFSATVGAANPAAQPVSITNTGGGTLAYTAADDAAWLTETPTSGSAPSSVSASVDITGLAAGTYTATITITSSGTTGSPKSIPVTLTVAAAAPSGLVGAWGFDESSGTTATDASGKANTGTITGATRTTAGKFGSALTFNGTSNWVTVPNSTSLALTTGMTLEGWAYPTANGSASWRAMMVKETSDGLAWALYPFGDGAKPSGHAFTTGAGELWATGSTLPALNAWSHLAVTYDGTTIRLYLNGTQVATKAQTGPLVTSTQPLRFGGDAVWPEWFKGRLDELRVYNRALTATEVQSDMNKAVNSTALLQAAKRTASTKTTQKPAATKRKPVAVKIKRYRGKHPHGKVRAAKHASQS